MTSKKTIRNPKHVNYYQLAVDFENNIITLDKTGGPNDFV